MRRPIQCMPATGCAFGAVYRSLQPTVENERMRCDRIDRLLTLEVVVAEAHD